MARRRMLTQELIYDEEFNSLTVEGQLLFTRMLIVSDDFGIVPATLYTLEKLTNPSKKIAINLAKYLSEIVDKGLGVVFQFEDKQFFMFKPESFQRINSYLIKNRTRSEYLRKDAEFLQSEKFLEILEITGNSGRVAEKVLQPNKRRTIKDKSLKIREEEWTFEIFWNLYDKKVDRLVSERKWNKLNAVDQEAIINYIPKYILSQPDKSLRKNPVTFFNNRSWENEIIERKTSGINPEKYKEELATTGMVPG